MALLGMNPANVGAVSLGNIQVDSHVGEPLQAIVPLTLAAGESMPKGCVAPATGSATLSSPKGVTVTSPAASAPGTYTLRVSTQNALYEPMYELALLIDCPGTPLLLRQYVLMLDLPVTTVRSQTSIRQENGDTLSIADSTNASPIVSSRAAQAPQSRQISGERTLRRSGAPIPAGSTYRVRQGDTLSTIAARVDGRLPDTTWAVANLLHAENPRAFVRNNPNLIKLGSKIQIPVVAELTKLDPGRNALANPSTANAQERTPQPFRDPTPAPEVKSTAAASNRTTPARTTAVTTTPPVDLSPNTPVAVAEDRQPIASEDAPISPFVEDDAPVSPFIDEQPETARQGTSASASAEPAPVPVITTVTPVAAEPATNESNPLLAILIGMLLGMVVSLVMLRGKLIGAVRSLFSRRPKVVARSTADAEQTHEADPEPTFDESIAGSAFDTQESESTDALPVGDPAESTYIVETSEPEPTGALDPADELPAEEAESVDADAANAALDQTDESEIFVPEPTTSRNDDELLAQLFEEGSLTPPTGGEIFDPANSSTVDPEIFDPTGGDDSDVYCEPTAEMPRASGAEQLEPTAELPTAEAPALNMDSDMIFDDAESLDPTVMSELDDQLENIDPTGLFSPGDAFASVLGDDNSPTAEMTVASEPGNLDQLPTEEDELSDTLNEALSLLERDFEDEFTASQVIERSEIKKSLESGNVDVEIGDAAEDGLDTATLQKNIS